MEKLWTPKLIYSCNPSTGEYRKNLWKVGICKKNILVSTSSGIKGVSFYFLIFIQNSFLGYHLRIKKLYAKFNASKLTHLGSTFLSVSLRVFLLSRLTYIRLDIWQSNRYFEDVCNAWSSIKKIWGTAVLPSSLGFIGFRRVRSLVLYSWLLLVAIFRFRRLNLKL